ncbi:MAG TPA: hypothetical protein VK174_00375 [Chitinophagales bacterium]|nr:hypothetical protein [Chitinophagales bacterium]
MNRIKPVIFIILTFVTLSVTMYSCKPDTNTCDNCEVELITSAYVSLTDSATGAVSHFAFRDLDGDGANAPVQFDTIQLSANHTYNATLLVLDESKTPADTISNEILEEANDHQFFYHTHDVTVNFAYVDFDSNTPALPIGLQTKWYVGSTTGNGNVHIELKHQPGIKDGNEATGDTDLSVEFSTRVQ